MICHIKVGGTDAVTNTITKTKSVASGLRGSDHRWRGRTTIPAVTENTMDANRDPTPIRFLATTDGGVEVSSADVPGGAPRLRRVRKSKREKKAIATSISKILANLPLSKLKIVIGTSKLPQVS